MALTGSLQGAEINVTPLIDILLVLLIIFMVIVPAQPRGLESAIPQEHHAALAADPPVRVQVLARGREGVAYRVGEREVGYEGLRPALASLFAARQNRTLLLEADRRLAYRSVAEVIGEAKMAGAGSVVLGGGRRP